VTETDLLVGLAVLVGLVGIVVPVLPGSILILGAVLLWSVVTATTTGWLVFAVVTTLLVAGGIVKYALPGRGLRTAGVPNRTLVAGGVLGVVGFFVVPVVGLVLGFVLGVYLSELQRVGTGRAWPSTRAALRAVGLSMLIELAAGMLAAVTWLAAAVLA
jgi:uncharacterized protein YqgC (DUF456 family)